MSVELRALCVLMNIHPDDLGQTDSALIIRRYLTRLAAVIRRVFDHDGGVDSEYVLGLAAMGYTLEANLLRVGVIPDVEPTLFLDDFYCKLNNVWTELERQCRGVET